MHDMAHLHARSHLVRRQRNNDDADVEIVTAIVIATQFGSDDPVETPKPKLLPPPATRERPSTTSADDDDDEPQQTAKPTSTARKPSSALHSDSALLVDETSTASRSPKPASTLMLATKSPMPSLASSITGLASASAAISASASPSSSNSADSEDGMSTGAMAGLALGILLFVCAILTGILLLYRRKKNQMASAAAAQENEKTEKYNAPVPPPPQVVTTPAAAPSINSTRTAATAPRLSLRPVTQFDPTFNEQSKIGGASLAAGAAVAQSNNNLSPSASAERPASAWERRGAANVPTNNPFNDPEPQSGPASPNPFGNKAAVDTQQASIPDSPPNTSPVNSAIHSSKPSGDSASPAITAAAASAAALAAAMAPNPPPKSDLPPPPPVAPNAGNVSPSPAWAENIPASPGPAPTGPPPVAGAMAGGAAPGSNNVHRVQLDFKPSMQDELDLHAGQLVRMLHEYDDGWVRTCLLSNRAYLTNLNRLSASVWTARSKELFPAHVSPSTQSSRATVPLVKARHRKVPCVALLFARPWVPAVCLSHVLFRPAVQ